MTRILSISETGSYQPGPPMPVMVKAMRAEAAADTAVVAGEQDVTVTVNVRFLVSLKATRIGTRVERFEGGVAPGRANVPVTVYRQTSSGNVKVGTTLTESDGSWSLVQQFSGTGTFSFFAVAQTTADNDSNRSAIVRATIS